MRCKITVATYIREDCCVATKSHILCSLIHTCSPLLSLTPPLSSISFSRILRHVPSPICFLPSACFRPFYPFFFSLPPLLFFLFTRCLPPCISLSLALPFSVSVSLFIYPSLSEPLTESNCTQTHILIRSESTFVMILQHLKLDGAASAVRHVLIIACRILVHLIYGSTSTMHGK